MPRESTAAVGLAPAGAAARCGSLLPTLPQHTHTSRARTHLPHTHTPSHRLGLVQLLLEGGGQLGGLRQLCLQVGHARLQVPCLLGGRVGVGVGGSGWEWVGALGALCGKCTAQHAPKGTNTAAELNPSASLPPSMFKGRRKGGRLTTPSSMRPSTLCSASASASSSSA